MQPEVQIEGIDETVASLEALAATAGRAPGAWGAVEQIVLLAARTGAPRRTGRLASSGQPGRAAASAEVVFGGAGVPYANPIHWGWPARNIRPQPFLTTAVHRTEPVWMAAYEARLQDAIDKEQG